ncbi:MAG: dipeptide ABC transporter ATP-binding protein [Alphaproteobacteria bacterium]|nr:dipeptide ABC transporter ATP-binding protein [Alphaproteobacteria bacterium]
MSALLSISHFSLSFGESRIIRDISLDIWPGEMVAIVGESGSGKSLTALSCLGLQPAGAQVSGEIMLDGYSLPIRGRVGVGASTGDSANNAPLPTSPLQGEELRALRGKTASMIFQEPMTALNPLHPIGKQIGEMLKKNSSITQSSDHRIIMLLEEVGLSHLASRLGAYPHELSGGERQRVMIAMAIANSPKLLIADEPTTAVDVTIQAKILKLLKELQKTRNMAMMFITHDITLVRKLADRVVVMKSGEIVEQGKVSEVFSRPQHPYTHELLGSEPKGTMPPLPANAPVALSCEGLKVHFPVKTGLLRRTTGFIKAVDGISVTIPESSTLGIVGESGSGKSTLGFALLRLVKSEGKIVWLGRDIATLSSAAMRPLRKEMQLVFQDPYSSLNPRMTVGDIIGEGLRVHRVPSTEYRVRIARAIEEVGLSPDMAERYPHEFSGGQRQRIAIARAMILKPQFVVLDEPTSALDLTVQTQIIALLKDFQIKYGISYLFISHDLRVVRAIAHHIAVLYKGEMVEYGKASDILTHPAQDYTRRLIEAAMFKGEA